MSPGGRCSCQASEGNAGLKGRVSVGRSRRGPATASSRLVRNLAIGLQAIVKGKVGAPSLCLGATPTASRSVAVVRRRGGIVSRACFVLDVSRLCDIVGPCDWGNSLAPDGEGLGGRASSQA